jgi:asparagine synthase (glutamine-hydrolysing)
MCGIAGFIHIGGAPSFDARAIIGAMTRRIAHRGPDGEAAWVSPNGRVTLGHRRLAIVDLSPLGAQPMTNEDGSVWGVFNGEIYNHDDLREQLRQRGHTFRSRCDTEVLLHLWEEKGEAMVHDLDGDFAFCLWDEKRQRAFLARDPVGVKPLYFATTGGAFVFGSEIKALLEHPAVPKRIDPEGVYHYLTYLVVPAPHTMFAGISKLGAGQCLSLDARTGQTEIRNYWEPLPRSIDLSPREWDAELRRLFLASVKKRLMSDVPVGLLFSGGVDSTLNTAAFKSLIKPQDVHTYNVSMSSPRFRDEQPFAQAVAEGLGTVHRHIRVTEDHLLESFEDIVYHQDEPLADPVCLPLYHVTKMARADGMTVLQAGEGADEIFCGYDNFRRFLRQDRQLWQPLSHLPRSVATTGFHLMRLLSRKPKTEKIADVLRRRGLGQEFFMSEAVAFYEYEKQRVISPEFARQMRGVDSFDVVRPLYERIRTACPDSSQLQIMTYSELRLRLPELLLMRSDKMAMAHSIELRVPFLDRDLVDFALSMPESYKVRDGVSKEPIKSLATELTASELARELPPEAGTSTARGLFYREKTGFGAPLQDWFGARLGEDFRRRLKKNPELAGEFFRLQPIEEELNSGAATVNRSFHLWVAYNLVVWREKFGV